MSKKKEELKGKKPQENVERYLVTQGIQPMFGVEVTKDTDIDDIACNGEVHQTIKDLVFTTEIKRERDDSRGNHIKEESTLVINLKEGERLIWSEYEGYTLLGIKPMTVDEMKGNIEEIEKCEIEGLK